ncbi:MAG TPA: hypothetical protein PKZ76_00750 [Xanthomonadaceae bacterium]|nr:hypothetical protein [Xanthomonadaceae bacterium]
MQLDRIAIALRPRQGFEAIDLGFRMTTRWAMPLWSVWFTLFLPFAAAVLVTLREYPFLAALVLWWSKPVFDRFLLHVLGHAVFGEPPGLAATLGAWREILGRGLMVSLLLRPFAWQRSFFAPVYQLERQGGKAARQRNTLLARKVGGHLMALALVCFCFELVVIGGGAMMAEMLWPGVDRADPDDMPFFEPTWWSMKLSLLYVLAVSVIEPFYVGAGFALYLNRRVMLEGWDIELGLRRLARGAASAVLMVFALALVLAGSATHVMASPTKDSDSTQSHDERDCNFVLWEDEEDCDEPGAATGQSVPSLDTPARRAVLEVMSDPVFGRWDEVERWSLRQRRDRSSRDLSWLGEIGKLMSSFLKGLSWLVLAALAVALVWTLARHYQRRPVSEPGQAAPAVLFGLAISPDSLPQDVAATALAALAEGRLREALSLLYRGVLSVIVHRHGLRIGEGATEGDVQRATRRALGAGTADYLERLLPAWIAVAYGHRAPESAEIAALCRDYAQQFQANDAVQAPP